MSYVSTSDICRKPGIYVHIPFCQSKCGYCDFYSITNLSMQGKFIHSLCHEFKLYHRLAKTHMFDSIYIGGGTPSILRLRDLESILNTIYRYYSIDEKSEITIEINPGTVDYQQLRSYRLMGFNRLSIGIQSFTDSELKSLQRMHTSADSFKTIKNARRAGFSNISIDLIYAIPEQTKNSWLYSLNTAIEQESEHISAYLLSIEKDTPFHNLLNSGKISLHSNESEAYLFNLTEEILSKKGYRRYEISNFAQADIFISQHNSKYWDHTPYLGFGPSAHSFWDNRRHSNTSSVSDYIKRLNRSLSVVSHFEALTSKMQMFEFIFLGLRTSAGINLNSFRKRFNKDFKQTYSEPIKKLTSENLALFNDQQFQLTRKGLLLSDEISPLFLQN